MARAPAELGVVKKRCTVCGICKSINTDNFFADAQKKSGFRPECKVCTLVRVKKYQITHQREYNKWKAKWRRNNPGYKGTWWSFITKEGRKHRKLMHLYGISLKQFKDMCKHQRGLCALCGLSFTKKDPPCTDHNHETEKVRGVIHMSCNRGLGMFKDQPWLCFSAGFYLVNEPHS
jgi:hypothetical protein